MNAPKSYRILLADDHALFLSGLSGLLARRPECEVVGTAANGAECLELIRTVPHDVVLMDIDMPVMDGIEATERALAEHPDEKIITLSMHAEETFYFRMVEAGAKGFILKSADLDEVVAAIHVVCEGGSFFSQELLQHLVGSRRPRGTTSPRNCSRTGRRRSCCSSARDSPTRRSATGFSSPNARWTSTAPTSSKKPDARIRPIWSSGPSRTAWWPSEPTPQKNRTPFGKIIYICAEKLKTNTL